GLGHVGAGVEVELHQGEAADVARFDVIDAADVEEVVFEVVGDEPLHLLGAHAAVGLGDVDDGGVEVGEDVGRHAVDGDEAGQGHGEDADDDSVRVTESGYDGVHRDGLGSGRRDVSVLPVAPAYPKVKNGRSDADCLDCLVMRGRSDQASGGA